MNSFWSDIRIIPKPAWVVAGLLTALVVLPLLIGPMRFDQEMRSWPLIAKIGLIGVVPVFIVSYAMLVGFIYADAKRRRMRHVMWAWLAMVPYFLGVILYFILRDPLPEACPGCGKDVPPAFAFCPGCGASIHPVCSRCGKPLKREWANCPHCGNLIVQAV